MSRWPPPPTVGASFFKAHGLGNDYLVFDEGDAWRASSQAIASVCDPHRGVGSDGIVVLLEDRSGDVFRARMFNPDGSEFERSGNGLRVLGAYLTRVARKQTRFTVEVGGERVALEVHGRQGGTLDISVEMGRAETGPAAVALDPKALDEEGRIAGPDGVPLRVVPVSVGNPHLVVLTERPTEDDLARVGAHLVGHPALAHGANVQLASNAGSSVLRALIWERGVGPTSASGTSACAVAVAAVREGWAPPSELRVEMPGGALSVTVSASLDVVLRGPVEEVCLGTLLLP
ncbi:MAG: diaminopimelate epimerase [Gemmatimonadota bacterium]